MIVFKTRLSAMSRGPGHVEKAIEAAFSNNPDRTFSVEELVALVYPGTNRPERKHRAAVLRSADKVAARMWWQGHRSEAPGGAVVYKNLLNVRSYALGRMRTDFINNGRTLAQIEAMLDDDTGGHRSHWHLVQPGGAWWKHVEINRLAHEGKRAESDAMREAHNASVAALLRRVGR